MATTMASSFCLAASAPTIASRSQQLVGTTLTISTPTQQQHGAPASLMPRASRVCDLTGKKANNGYKVSFSNHRTKHLQGVNLQYKRLWWEEGKRFVKLRLSTKALKTVEKKGLQVMAKEAGIDLADY